MKMKSTIAILLALAGAVQAADIQTADPYAKQFNPVKYNPDAWAKLAHDAGMRYMVITAKPLKFERNDKGIIVSLPAAAPDPISSTVVLKVQGAPEVQPFVVRQAPDGALKLATTKDILNHPAPKTKS